MNKYSIAFLSETASSYGVFMFANIKNDSFQARIQKSKTLDGGVSLINFGAFEADKTINISKIMSQDEFDEMIDFMLNISNQFVLTKTGAYAGAISSITQNSITFEVSEKLSS